MAWTTLDYSKRKVDWAGKVLSNRPSDRHRPFKGFQEVLEWSEALQVINNFRSTHGYPLHATTMTLRQRVPKVDNRAVVASRLKRLVSIEAKLERFSWLKLSRMQDIGGCRAVVANVKKVEELHDMYASGRTSAKLRRVDDYIVNPRRTVIAASIMSMDTRPHRQRMKRTTASRLRCNCDPPCNTSGLPRTRLYRRSRVNASRREPERING